MRLRYIAVSLLLAGCAQEIQSSSPDMIVTLNDTAAPQEAIDAATAHCAKHGKRAVFQSAGGSGYIVPHNIANVFRCE